MEPFSYFYRSVEEKLLQPAFQQTLRDKFTFQQDNNPKLKANLTLELLTMTTLNVPEWPGYNFDFALNRLKSIARLYNVVLAMIKNQLDRT
jgi:hypothetical protein